MVWNPFESAAAARRYALGRPYYHEHVMGLASEFLRERVPVEHALDVGCGTGQSTRALLRLAGHVLGLDLSRAMVKEAAARLPQSFAVAGAEQLPLRSASCDLIAVSAAFHWFDQKRFLEEARRVARAGAVLLVYDNGFAGIVEGVEEFPRWMREVYLGRFPAPPRHGNFSPELAAELGFRVEHSQRYHNWVEMGVEELVNLLLTQSNVTSAIEERREAADSIATWLQGQLTALLQSGGGSVRQRCLFGGPLWIASHRQSERAKGASRSGGGEGREDAGH